SKDFRCLSSLAIKKASIKGNLQSYPYLLPGHQICSLHYTAIVENQLPTPAPAQNESYNEVSTPTLPINLSLGSGATCDTINTLSNTGILVTYQTVYNYKKKIAGKHPIRVKKYFNDNKNLFCIYNLDDYHNIHENRRPDNTSLSGAVHLATCVCKKVERSNPVPVIFNNKSVHNLNNINASIICERLINRYQYCFNLSYSQRMAQWNSLSFPNFDRIDQLSIHFYDNAIEERKDEHKMKGAILSGVKEQQLHSMQDYLNALNIILDYNKEIGYLDSNVAPIVAN
ncbi:11446_t:CDS:2, partial [Dentiscutata erythropus]